MPVNPEPLLGELPGGLEPIRPTPAEVATEREKNG
jgi:hypothetical protein